MMSGDEPQLDLNVLPRYRDLEQWSRHAMMYRFRTVEQIRRRIRIALYEANIPELKTRLKFLANGYSSASKSQLIKIVRYLEWEIKHYEETGKVSIGYWKES